MPPRRVARDGGGQPAGGMDDVVAVAAQDVGDPGRGVVLLESGLRVGMDAVGQVEDLVPGGLDGLGETDLVGFVGRGRTSGGQRGHTVSCWAVGGPRRREA